MPNSFTIYHNPRCSKSRQTLAILQDNNIQPEVVLYLDTPPSAEELQLILKKLKLPAEALLRKGEAEYKAHKAKNTMSSENEIIQLMARIPKLIERPIVIKGNRAVIGRPPENVLELI